jgi:hypothetical protein
VDNCLPNARQITVRGRLQILVDAFRRFQAGGLAGAYNPNSFP